MAELYPVARFAARWWGTKIAEKGCTKQKARKFERVLKLEIKKNLIENACNKTLIIKNEEKVIDEILTRISKTLRIDEGLFPKDCVMEITPTKVIITTADGKQKKCIFALHKKEAN